MLGSKRSIAALAHTILVVIYHLLRRAAVHQHLGGNYFDEGDRQVTVRRAVNRLESLGYNVVLQPG